MRGFLGSFDPSAPRVLPPASFDGELYNQAALGAELEIGGDPKDILIEGLKRWGLLGLLKRLDGMYAFCLWDERARKLYLARDPAGRKPLFYAEDRGRYHFGSDLAAVQKLRPRRAQLSKAGLEAFLTLKYVPSPLSLIDGMRRVPAAHFLEIDASGSRLRAYWSPLSATLPSGPPADLVDAAIAAATKKRLSNDGKACLFLSGGVDSSMIAHKLAHNGLGGCAAYTIGYSDMPTHNEFDDASIVAGKYPLDHRAVIVSSRQVQDILQDDASVFDEPMAEWIWVPLHFLSQRAAGDGFATALVGDGSDELFFGSEPMLRGLRDLRRFRSAAWRGLARAGYRLSEPFYGVTHRGHKRFDLWRRAAIGAPLYWGGSMGFRRTERRYVAGPALGPAAADPAGDFIALLYQRFEREARDPEDLVNLVCFIEFQTRMAEPLLHRLDRVTSRFSLQARAPFLDRDLCELAFAIPGATKAPGGRPKALLKEVALRHLPPSVVQRTKMSFALPFGEWLRGPLGGFVDHGFETSRLFKEEWLDRPFCRRLLHEHQSMGRDHSSLLWMIHSLTRWYDRWIG